MDINFREAQRTDLAILMQYMREFHDFDHSERFDEVPARAAMEKVVLDKTVGRVWLIQQADEVVGYSVLTLAYRLEYRGYYAFLDELYVRADKRGQGIGTQAIQFLQQACKQLDVTVLQLEVKQDNPQAASLYRKAGFEQQARHLLTKTISRAEKSV